MCHLKRIVGIKLDTTEIFDNSEEKVEKSDVKIVFPEDKNDVSIPTEIFIEDSEKDKPLDLFKETDPFLDDNEFEIGNSLKEEGNSTSMPTLKNIGTVKPNSVLSEIEGMVESVDKNDDIILPSMGLTDINKSDVPIVSENYIN